MRRRRPLAKTALAVAGILATPLFFVALMAMSLALEKPTVHHLVQSGKAVTQLGDPSGSNEAAIWLLALAPSAAVLAVGAGAMLVRRFATVLPAAAAIVAAVVLLVPLGGWVDDHAARYPDGVDLTPTSAGTGDLILRGEWEDSARTAAEQIGYATISLAGVAILVTLAHGLRRRQLPVPPPPPELTGQASGGI
jgi:hypothetical protein